MNKKIKQVFTVIIEGEDDLGEIDLQTVIETYIKEQKLHAELKDVIYMQN